MSLIAAVADYTASFAIESDSALETARQCLIDALARGFEALRDPECACLMGPLVPGALMPGGARIPGTSLELDPAQAAFCLGVMLCRLPSGEPCPDLPPACAASLGAVLATADYVARRATMEGKSPPTVRDVLAAIVKALEIQDVPAPGNGSQRAWIATLRLARLAATAVATAQLGGTPGQIVSALSYASLDGGMLVEADEPSDIARRDWATAEAISHAVRHACYAMASARSSRPTAIDLETVDLAGRLLSARTPTRGQPFGTEVIERLAGRRSPQDVTRLTVRFQSAVNRYFPLRQAERIKALFAAPGRLAGLPVNELLATLVTNGAR
ncbi:MAG: MmgE/PrpD family protein [Steroidobacteraceae bacterium]